jgi:hypothetical protein
VPKSPLVTKSSRRTEHILSTRRQQQTHPDGDDCARIAKARQEAEALFARLERPTSGPSVPNPVTSPDPSARKPRILRALSTPPDRHRQVPVNSERRTTPEISKSHVARIQAWVKYGMTAAQVAGIYGVGVEAIEGILNQV